MHAEGVPAEHPLPTIAKGSQMAALRFKPIFRLNLFDGSDAADGGSAVGALALDDGLTVFRSALDGIFHDLLRLALYAIRFDCHELPQFFPE